MNKEERLTFLEAFRTGPGDWTEDFPHENGGYSNRCTKCRERFVGHKRRVICRVCANPRPPQTDCQHEPPYPGAETVVFSIRAPDHTCHLPSERCQVQEPHLIADCSEFVCPACNDSGHQPKAPWLLCTEGCAAALRVRIRSGEPVAGQRERK